MPGNSDEDVLPPTDYVYAVQNSLIDRNKDQEATVGPVAYKGNSQDVGALVSAVVAITALFSCCGVYCLPIMALALATAAYLNADKANDPIRTLRLAGIGLGAGGLMVMAAFASIGLDIVPVAAAIVSIPSP